ncbi:coiled-coil domain-containing protein 15 isoform X2 [Heptranchias perlo]|uniref:coiled-coil domain-containing protein 15 isoform X2 n=1 Tax=Heptranchias perlo TaxID=212740 RepID=UPI0035595C77
MPLKAQCSRPARGPGGDHKRSRVGRVLAERNQAVAPVGAWVECARDWQEEQDPAFISALEVDEQLKEIHRAKVENLKRFQDEVKHRVSEYARMHKKQQQQRSCEAVERDDRVIKQSCASAEQLTPKKNTCMFRGSNVEFAIFSPSSRWVYAQGLGNDKEEDEDAFSDQARKNPVSRRETHLNIEEDFMCLEGQHDLPAELQEQPQKLMGGKHVTFQPGLEHEKPCSRLYREPYPTGSCLGFSTDYKAALILRPGVDQEESKKRRGNQYLMYRRLFMDIEREQVKEQRRQQEHEKRIAKIKEEKEKLREAEEKRMIELTRQRELVTESGRSAQLKEEERQKRADEDKAQRNREITRYIEALRAQMMEKIKLQNTDLPPLCCCGSNFWDSHPDTCANNCVFYKNPKAYARALQSVLSSCDAWDGHYRNRTSMKKIASVHLCSARK